MSGIKIIAGLARGRSIKTFKEDDLSVRPILARIKKSLFDILRNKVPNSNFLDLYSGTGAVGLEAVSRGASHVVFVDGDNKCVNIVKENLKLLKFEDKASVYQANVLGDMSWLKGKFDIIFLGPPYKDMNKVPISLTSPTINGIDKAGLLKPDGWIIGQHHIKEKLEQNDKFEVFREEKYGDTIVSFIKYKAANI